MSYASVLPTASEAYVCCRSGRSRQCLALPRWTLRVHRRINVIMLLLCFVTFVATSSPHRVHHLGDAAPSPHRLDHERHTHHAHDHVHPPHPGQPAQQPHEQHTSPLSECVVLMLLRSLPMFEAEHTVLSAPLVPQPCDVLAPWLRPREAYTHSCLARAPPLVIV